MKSSEIKMLFAKKYPYVNVWDVSDNDILTQWNKPYMANFDEGHKLDMLYDFILSNNLTDVQY